jgi:hypothetical protein
MTRKLLTALLFLSVLTMAACEDCCLCDPCLFSAASNTNSCSNTNTGPTIGAANGTQCTTISKTEVSRGDAVRCGFNDLSIPNIAVFEQERLSCTEYNNGNVVRTFQDTKERFLRCHEP